MDVNLRKRDAGTKGRKGGKTIWITLLKKGQMHKNIYKLVAA